MKKNLFAAVLILSGILCGLLQAWLNIPVLSFFAFAPLFYGLCYSQGRAQYLVRFLQFFMPYYLTQLSFLVTAYHVVPIPKFFAVIVMVLVVVMLSVWECFLMFIPLYLLMWLKRSKITDVIFIALLIAGGEWLQENIVFLSFPWSAVWLCVTDAPLFMQTANLLGCRVVTFIILATNGFVMQAVVSDKKLASLSALALLQSVTIFYGIYSVGYCDRLSRTEEKITAVCAQDEIEGEKKAEISPMESAQTYLSLLREGKTDGADLVLLPETAVSMDFDEDADEFKLLSEYAKLNSCTVVTGCFSEDSNDYNAMYAISPDGVYSAPYCKQVLVPFGEKIPFAFLTGEPTLSECSDKEKILPLKSGNYTIGTAICIESIYSTIVKAQTKAGAQVLCISTNDSWFGKSFARGQHFRHSIMRAVENQRYLLRAGNCGISAIISPSGKIVNVKSDNSKGIISAEITMISQKSFFGRIGDWFCTLPILLAVTGVVKRFTRKA